MKPFKFFIAPFFIVLLFCTRCKFNNQSVAPSLLTTDTLLKPKFANGFLITRNNKTTTLHINNSNDTLHYNLVSKKIPVKNKNTNPTIQIPIKKFIASSTTDIPFFEALNTDHKLIGFSETKYISSPKTRKRIDNNEIQEIGNTLQLNIEKILELQPELFIGFNTTSKNKSIHLLERNGITTLVNNSWLETNPLARTEWIKLFGYLFDKQNKADSIFNAIEKNYNLLKKVTLKATQYPSVLSGNLYKDVWYTPAGESFEANLIKDAKGDYLWKNSKGTGSLSLSIETVIEKGQKATIWLGGGMFDTTADLVKFEEKYDLFKAVKTKKVYTKDLMQGATGGILYFETGALRPDWILEDLIQIFHPNLIEKKPFHFYKPLK